MLIGAHQTAVAAGTAESPAKAMWSAAGTRVRPALLALVASFVLLAPPAFFGGAIGLETVLPIAAVVWGGALTTRAGHPDRAAAARARLGRRQGRRQLTRELERSSGGMEAGTVMNENRSRIRRGVAGVLAALALAGGALSLTGCAEVTAAETVAGPEPAVKEEIGDTDLNTAHADARSRRTARTRDGRGRGGRRRSDRSLRGDHLRSRRRHMGVHQPRARGLRQGTGRDRPHRRRDRPPLRGTRAGHQRRDAGCGRALRRGIRHRTLTCDASSGSACGSGPS